MWGLRAKKIKHKERENRQTGRQTPDDDEDGCSEGLDSFRFSEKQTADRPGVFLDVEFARGKMTKKHEPLGVCVQRVLVFVIIVGLKLTKLLWLFVACCNKECQ